MEVISWFLPSSIVSNFCEDLFYDKGLGGKFSEMSLKKRSKIKERPYFFSNPYNKCKGWFAIQCMLCYSLCHVHTI